jgi:bacteriorhodopsin
MGSPKFHPTVVGAQSESEPSVKSGEVAVSRPRSRCMAQLEHPFAWVVITIAVALLAGAIVQPSLCSGVDQCKAAHEGTWYYNGGVACGLGTVFLHELACLYLTYRNAKSAMHLIGDIKETLIPSALLCATFAVLFVENSVLATGSSPWFAHSMKVGDQHLDERPVYTIFYLEWLINVPILLLLAGRHALRRPIAEVVRPLVVTNIYIILAWSAHFITNSPARYLVVFVTFAMYFWASVDMARWVKGFREDNPQARMLGRPLLTAALIIIFGIYGVMYLCRLLGSVDAEADRLFYTCMNAGSKLLFSMAFAGIRSSAYHNMLLYMLANTNTVFQRGVAPGEGDPFLRA